MATEKTAMKTLLEKQRTARANLRKKERREQQRLDEWVLRLFKEQKPDTYKSLEAAARIKRDEERATRSSRAKAASASEQPGQGDAQPEQPGVMQHD